MRRDRPNRSSSATCDPAAAPGLKPAGERRLVVNLDLTPQKIELVYGDLDTNAVNFHLPRPDSFFCIQAGVYLEDDEELNLPYFELNEQGNSDHRRIEAITFSGEKIMLSFGHDRMFLKKYSSVTLHFGAAVERVLTYQTEDSAFQNYKYESIAVPSTEPIDRTLVDFLQTIYFSADISATVKISQNRTR
jgi:hypothetical protein